MIEMTNCNLITGEYGKDRFVSSMEKRRWNKKGNPPECAILKL
jgi:hypothetical protein